MPESTPSTKGQWRPRHPLPESIRDRELMLRALRQAAKVAAQRKTVWADQNQPDRPEPK